MKFHQKHYRKTFQNLRTLVYLKESLNMLIPFKIPTWYLKIWFKIKVVSLSGKIFPYLILYRDLYNPFKPPEGSESSDLEAFNFVLGYLSGRTVFTIDMFARGFADDLKKKSASPE